MTAQEYADDLYYNRSCGQFLNEDSYFEQRFTALDIEDAYERGQMAPDKFTIERIFQLNTSYLDVCRSTQSTPNREGRLNYIIQNL